MHVNAATSPISLARATWKDYVTLTKPRVISLLLFTAIAAMFIAAKGWPGGWPLLVVAIAGYMSAGSANAVNMVIDRDIDSRMKRTTHRPTVTNVITPIQAMTFALTMQAASFGMLWRFTHLLAALMSLSGFLCYVFVYTLLLKRRTPQNIVIGGAAGAFPPLVGYAAVTGNLDALAWTLFGLIFVWTPVHFWALAIMIKDDYAAAGIPMLPVVSGTRHTVIQIVIYAIITLAVAVAPYFFHATGLLYLVCAALLSGWLLFRSVALLKSVERPVTLRLYLFSMLYLALLFAALAVDRMVLS